MLAKNALSAKNAPRSVVVRRMLASPAAFTVLMVPLASGLFFLSGWCVSVSLSLMSLMM